MSALHHMVYTNVSDAGSHAGRGFRLHAVAPSWSAAEQDRLVAWLRTLAADASTLTASTLTASTLTGTHAAAVHSLRLAGALHAGLAVVDGDFGHDAFGRRGVVVHALLTPLDERAPADDFVGSLLAHQRGVARAMEAPGTEKRLAPYLAACRAQRARVSRPQERGAWTSLLPSAVRRVWSLAAQRAGASLAAPGVTLPIPSANDPVAWAVSALSLLPPRLRLLFRWRVGLAPGAGTVTLVPAETASMGERVERAADDPRVTLYDGWLRASSAAPSDAWAPAEDWRLRSWDALAAAVSSMRGEARSSA